MKKRDPVEVFRKNLEMLMEDRDYSQTSLAEATRKHKFVSQKNISNILKIGQVPKVDTVESLARVFGLSGWQMLASELDPDLNSRDTVVKLMAGFNLLDDRDREEILRHVEMIVRDRPQP